MRSLILTLALAAPLSAVAAAPSYSNPLNNMHHQKAQEVFMTFVNYTVQDREVQLGDHVVQDSIASGSCMCMRRLERPVFVYSQTNSKVNGQELMLRVGERSGPEHPAAVGCSEIERRVSEFPPPARGDFTKRLNSLGHPILSADA